MFYSKTSWKRAQSSLICFSLVLCHIFWAFYCSNQTFSLLIFTLTLEHCYVLVKTCETISLCMETRSLCANCRFLYCQISGTFNVNCSISSVQQYILRVLRKFVLKVICDNALYTDWWVIRMLIIKRRIGSKGKKHKRSHN